MFAVPFICCALELGIMAPGPIFCASSAFPQQSPLHEPTKAKVPEDFTVFAEFLAGHEVLEGTVHWTLTIDHTGKAVQEYYLLPGIDTKRKGHQKKTVKLSARDMEEILRAVEDTAFIKLKSRYGHPFTPPVGKVIVVQARGKRHRVEVFLDPTIDLSCKKDVASFQKLWSELLRKMPSPNRDPTGDDR